MPRKLTRRELNTAKQQSRMLRVGTRVYNDFLFKFMKKHETEIIDEFIRINPKSSRFISDAIDSDGKEMRSTNRWAAFWQQPAWADQFQALGLAWRSFSGNATFESLNFVGDGIEFGLSPKAVLQGGSAAPRARQARATRGTLTTARQERKERGERRGRKTRKSVLKFTKTSTSTLFLKVGGGGTETVSKQDEGENFFNVTETAADWHRDSGLRLGKTMADSVKPRLNKKLAEGYVEEWSVSKIRKELRAELVEFETWQLTRIVRTETSFAANAASLEGYKQSGVVETKTFMNGDPEHEICIALDGVTIPLDRDFSAEGWSGPSPPTHPNCQSFTAPGVSRVKSRDQLRHYLEAKPTPKIIAPTQVVRLAAQVLATL